HPSDFRLHRSFRLWSAAAPRRFPSHQALPFAHTLTATTASWSKGKRCQAIALQSRECVLHVIKTATPSDVVPSFRCEEQSYRPQRLTQDDRAATYRRTVGSATMIQPSSRGCISADIHPRLLNRRRPECVA